MNEPIEMIKGMAVDGRVSLAYEVFGPADSQPLLVMRVGMQMPMWHEDFCRETDLIANKKSPRKAT